MTTNQNNNQSPNTALQPFTGDVIVLCTIVFWSYWTYNTQYKRWELNNESNNVGVGKHEVSSWDDMQKNAESFVTALRNISIKNTGIDAPILAGPPVIIHSIPLEAYNSSKRLLEHCVLAGMREGYMRTKRYPAPWFKRGKKNLKQQPFNAIPVPDLPTDGQFDPGEEPEDAEIVEPAPVADAAPPAPEPPPAE